MWFGILLACLVPMDVTTCEVKPNTNKTFQSLALCQREMRTAAQYAASMGLVARPYCFELPLAT